MGTITKVAEGRRKTRSSSDLQDGALKEQKTSNFLHFYVERESASSCDLHLRKVLLSLDDLEIDIDAEMFNGIHVSHNLCPIIIRSIH